MSELPLVEVAYRTIREKLLNAEFLPGSLFSENELAQQLNMSRTPIRDAIRLLEQEGFVETLTKKGIRVNSIDINELFDMFDLLTALYLFALQVVEQYDEPVDLQTMERYLNQMIAASERKQFREYYESGLSMMRTFLESIHNEVILKTFDLYRDKIIFYIVSHRSYNNPSRPYTGKKSHNDIYMHLRERDYTAAKKALLDAKWYVRDEIVRTGRIQNP
ncbi:GntR family transcriptional regulator [Paenibacillus sp. 7541]|uniref:GntR family transcriptional regulator n=1 Tax=Paenibacillus sp. 7541 TaxID=2026236 RepID=UPI000BA64182|nr:GntR family transcriptional regulator [Paenibacillus sp. 7541]PAK55809.1 hypothetical protein CHH75_00630 [Paenibacillus sp. 7541]